MSNTGHLLVLSLPKAKDFKLCPVCGAVHQAIVHCTHVSFEGICPWLRHFRQPAVTAGDQVNSEGEYC